MFLLLKKYSTFFLSIPDSSLAESQYDQETAEKLGHGREKVMNEVSFTIYRLICWSGSKSR